MILPNQDTALSIHRASGYRDCLVMPKANLTRQGCPILSEGVSYLEIEREIDLHPRRNTVLVVWDPIPRYENLLSERSAGLFLPFRFVVADIVGSTLIAALNVGFTACPASTLSVQFHLRKVEHKIRSILSQLYRQDELACALSPSDPRPPLMAEALS